MFTWPAGVVPGQVYTCTHDGRNLEVAAPRFAQAGARFAATLPYVPKDDAPQWVQLGQWVQLEGVDRRRVRDIVRFQRVCTAFRDAAELVLAQEEAEAKERAKREVEHRAKLEEEDAFEQLGQRLNAQNPDP